MAINPAGKEVSILAILDVIRRRQLLVLGPAAVLMALVTVVVFQLPLQYRSKVLVAIQPMAARDYVQRDYYRVVPLVQEKMLAIREALYSPQVLEQAVQEFKLTGAGGGQLPPDELEKLKKQVTIEVDTDNSFRIVYDGRHAAETAQVANRLAELVVSRLSNVREREVEQASGFLVEELDRLRQKLAEQEENIKQYKQRAVNELPSRQDTNLKLFETTQTQIQVAGDQLSRDIARRAAVVEELKELEKQGVLKAQARRERTPQETKLAELQLQLNQYRTKYTPEHPEIARLGQEIADLEAMPAPKQPVEDPSPARLRHLQLKAEREELDRRIASHRNEQGMLTGRLGTLQRRLESTPVHETALAELTRDYESTRAQYAALMEKTGQATLSERLEKAHGGVVFRILEPASMPKEPHWPKRGRLLLMGLLASVGLGVLIAFGAEQMDTSFDDVDQFQAFTNLPLITAIPAISASPDSRVMQPAESTIFAEHPRGPDGARGGTVKLTTDELHGARLVTLTDPHSVAAEQYRILALKVRRQPAAGQAQTLAVTSSIGGEGKTVCALNLAFSLAAGAGERVLLVESDLRKPRFHEYLGLPASKGFSDLLRRPDDEIARYTWKVRNLHVMPGGTEVSKAVELLSAPDAKRLFERLREEFSFVLIDAPPVLPIVDTHILAGLVDAVLVVVRARYTRRELFQRAMEGFQVSNLMGVVLNDADYQRSRYAYAYQYYRKNYLAA